MRTERSPPVVRVILVSRQRSGLSHVYSVKIFGQDFKAKTDFANLQQSGKFSYSSAKTQIKPRGNTK